VWEHCLGETRQDKGGVKASQGKKEADKGIERKHVAMLMATIRRSKDNRKRSADQQNRSPFRGDHCNGSEGKRLKKVEISKPGAERTY